MGNKKDTTRGTTDTGSTLQTSLQAGQVTMGEAHLRKSPIASIQILEYWSELVFPIKDFERRKANLWVWAFALSFILFLLGTIPTNSESILRDKLIAF